MVSLGSHEEMLLALVRYSLSEKTLPEELFVGRTEQDWRACHALSSEQGVLAIAWDGVMALPSHLQPPKALKINWGLAVEDYERTYRRYCSTIGKLSDFYAENGITTVQLKGVGLSTYYPIPQRRQGGDIDIYTYSSDRSKLSDSQANELADQLMRDRGVEVEMHSYKHSNFYFEGISIENHKFFSNVKHYNTAAEADVLLQKVFDPYKVTLIGGEEILIPSVRFNSLFVVMHALQHFTTGLALHHLCDLVCVFKKVGTQLPLSLSDERFTTAVRAMVKICNDYLGANIPMEKADADLEPLCDIIMQEVLHPRYRKGQMPSNPIGIFWYKTRRFAYSARLKGKVWNTSIATAVWQSVVAHLKDPKTIFAGEE